MMTKSKQPAATTTRRETLKAAGAAASASVLTGALVPHVHAASDSTIRLALIGCGGRGTGAMGDALSTTVGPVKLHAMADLHKFKIEASHKSLSKAHPDLVDVADDRRFLGFDAYRKAIDCLRPGDVAVLTTRAAFRPPHFEYAAQKGINVFMEKSFATDPVGIRRMLAAADVAKQKNLKVSAGLMCRHSANRQELIKRVRNGDLGEILLLRAYRMHDLGRLARKPANESEIYWQLRSGYHLYWLSAGLFSEADIHQVDEMCWIKDAWPVSAHGVGGRAFGSIDKGQNLDAYSAEWTFADGAKAYYVLRSLPNCYNEFSTSFHGTKCAARFSGDIHAPISRIFKAQRFADDEIAWKAPPEPVSAYRVEWNVLFDAIRNDKPHNEAHRAAMAQAADFMGRAAVHMGRVVTRDEVLSSNFQWISAGIDSLNENSPPPVSADENGHYPVPVPGQWKEI